MGTFIVGLDDDDPGSFKGLLISVWIRNSTGPSPLLWRLILGPIHFPGWKKKEGFLQGLGEIRFAQCRLSALKDVRGRIRKRDEKNLERGVFNFFPLQENSEKTLDSSLFYLAMNWQFHN